MEIPHTPALESLQTRIRTAVATRTPLRIRGGGSKDFYGQTSQGELLDTSAYAPALAGVVSYEPSELVVTVRAGAPLAALEAQLAEQGQYLPFEPPHYRWNWASTGLASPDPRADSTATVGGMVAAGLSGPARASAGSVRDHVLGVTLLNGRAELLRFGGQVIKNVAGYDVSRVMVGALGTLGLLVDVSLKVLPVPPSDATLVFEMNQVDALAHLHRWGAQPLPLNSSCWVKDDAQGGRELLFLRLRGAVAAVEAACYRLRRDAPPGAKPVRMDNVQAVSDWALCRDHLLPFFTAPPAPGLALWRLSVAQTAPALDLPWPQFIEWHGAQRWLWAPLSAASNVRAAATYAKGHATIFVVTGQPNETAPALNDVKVEVFSTLASPLDRIHRQLKAEFDPAGIFNRGRLYGSF